MSDVLFRESTGKIEPTCIVFRETKLPEEQEKLSSSKFPRASVAEYIEYLDGEGRKTFDKLYLDILLGESRMLRKSLKDFALTQRQSLASGHFLTNQPQQS
jgi:hypothetical protein